MQKEAIVNNNWKVIFLSISMVLICLIAVGCQKNEKATEPESFLEIPNPKVTYADSSEKAVSAQDLESSVSNSADVQTMVVNGQSFSAWDFKVDRGTRQASVVVSFDLPSNADWMFNLRKGVRLTIDSETFLISGGGPIVVYVRSARDGLLRKISFDNNSSAGVVEVVTDPQEIPVRIERIYFDLSDRVLEKDLTGQPVKLVIDSLFLRPYEGQECDEEYLARAQARLDEVQKGIVLACGSGDFSQEIVVQQKPVGIDADAVIASVFPNGIFVDLNMINGPWEFILQP